MNDKKKCPVCGETDPFPAWFCMARVTGVAEKGKPCSYSVEGHERLGKKFDGRIPRPSVQDHTFSEK